MVGAYPKMDALCIFNFESKFFLGPLTQSRLNYKKKHLRKDKGR